MNIGAWNAPCLFLLLGAAAFFTGCGSFPLMRYLCIHKETTRAIVWCLLICLRKTYNNMSYDQCQYAEKFITLKPDTKDNII